MRTTPLTFALLLVLGSATARAGVSVHIDIGLPAAPPLVAVAPDVQVVAGFPEEVFCNAGWYWCRRPDGWYRARRPRDRFEWVDVHRVPPPLLRERPGYYRNWRQEGPRHDGRGPGNPGRGHGQRGGWNQR